MNSFWLALVLILFNGQAVLYGAEQSPDNVADKTLEWINHVRAQDGLQVLSIDTRLNMIAMKHSGQMIEHNMLTDSNLDLGTPFDRLQSSGLSDTNNLVVTAQAKNWDLLRVQLELPENLSKILSPEMTHAGIGIKQDSTGSLWLTVHMIERAITFTGFSLDQSNTTPVRRSITIKGNTQFKKIEVMLVPPQDSFPGLEKDSFIIPDSEGNFEVTLTFGTATGNFDFEFYVQKEGVYELKNSFSMGI